MLDKIQMNYHTLSVKEKEIAEYIMQHKHTILNIDIRELAQKTNASTSTITRFCKKIGCQSFVEFKIRLNGEIEKKEDSQTCFGKTESYYMNVIRSTTEIIDQELIFQVVNLIRTAPKILIYGVGSSGLSALELEYRLQRMGLNVDAALDTHMMLMSGALVQEYDLVICISNSGMTKEVIDAARVAKKNKALVVSITNYNHTLLTETSDIVLFTSSTTRVNDSQFVNSQLSIIYVLDVISLLLLENDELLRNHQKTLDVLREGK